MADAGVGDLARVRDVQHHQVFASVADDAENRVTSDVLENQLLQTSGGEERGLQEIVV